MDWAIVSPVYDWDAAADWSRLINFGGGAEGVRGPVGPVLGGGNRRRRAARLTADRRTAAVTAGPHTEPGADTNGRRVEVRRIPRRTDTWHIQTVTCQHIEQIGKPNAGKAVRKQAHEVEVAVLIT